MNEAIETGKSAVAQVLSMGPGLLTLCAAIVCGYILKFVPAMPNKWIPGMVVLSGGAWAPFLIPAQRVSSEVGNPTVGLVVMGLVLGFIAWLAHNTLLKKLEDKLLTWNKPKGPGLGPKVGLLLVAALWATGCASARYKATEERFDETGNLVAVIQTYGTSKSVFAGKQSAKTIAASNTADSQSIQIEGLRQESDASEAIRAAVEAAVEAAAKAAADAVNPLELP